MSDSVLATTTANLTESSVAGDLQRPRPRGFSGFVRKSPLGAICLFVLIFAIAFALIGPLARHRQPGEDSSVVRVHGTIA